MPRRETALRDQANCADFCQIILYFLSDLVQIRRESDPRDRFEIRFRFEHSNTATGCGRASRGRERKLRDAERALKKCANRSPAAGRPADRRPVAGRPDARTSRWFDGGCLIGRCEIAAQFALRGTDRRLPPESVRRGVHGGRQKSTHSISRRPVFEKTGLEKNRSREDRERFSASGRRLPDTAHLRVTRIVDGGSEYYPIMVHRSSSAARG